MKINELSYRKNNNINFKAREYAIVKTNLNNIQQIFKAYKLEYADRNFLDVMSAGIKLKKLTEGENYSNNVLRSWKRIINNAIMMATFDEPQCSFLLAKGKKPFSIMSYKNLPDCYLDNIASWPVSKNNYVKLAGASMFKLLFHNCEKNNTQKIGLDLLHNSRINLEKYYSRLGFEQNFDNKKFITDLFLSRTKMLETSKQMDSFVKVDEITNPVNVNLFKVLDTTFCSAGK